jgi:hypothetical protein
MEIHVVTTVFEIFCGVIKLSTGPDNVSWITRDIPIYFNVNA